MNLPTGSPTDQPLVPSDSLRERLSSGIATSMIAGGLLAGESLAEAISGERPGLTLARALGLCSLVPTLWIARAYGALGREAGRPLLGKGAWSILGATALLLLIDLGAQHVLPGAGQALVWSVVAIGLMLFPILLLLPDAGTSALVAAAFLSSAAQVRLATLPFAGLVVGLVVDWESIAGGVSAFLAVGFVLWFGAIKVRARRRLGGMAALLGWSEILGIVFSFFWVIAGYSIALAVSAHAGEPEPSEKLMAALDGQIARGVAIITLLVDLAWASLTAWFFLSIRRRRGPGPGSTPEDPDPGL